MQLYNNISIAIFTGVCMQLKQIPLTLYMQMCRCICKESDRCYLRISNHLKFLLSGGRAAQIETFESAPLAQKRLNRQKIAL